MLNPTFLLAATINQDGCIELPVAEEGLSGARALFWPGEHGELLQRVVPEGSSTTGPAARPLDMVFFARCLSRVLGALTPELFVVRGADATCGRLDRLAREDVASERARLAALRDAFLVHLAAYEDRLI